MSFWLKPRQIVIMDSQSSGPARNFTIRYFSLLLLLVIFTAGLFSLGAWYAPFHKVQEIIPENIKLKRQNAEMASRIADLNTTNSLKNEQLSSLKEQIDMQENEIVNVSKQLHMYKTILDERKGTGIRILENHASWVSDSEIAWKALFVKGGSYPRYLVGSYKMFALDDAGKKLDLNPELLRYKIETHAFMQRHFKWKESWKPTKLELVVLNSRKKEVLRMIVPLQNL